MGEDAVAQDQVQRLGLTYEGDFTTSLFRILFSKLQEPRIASEIQMDFRVPHNPLLLVFFLFLCSA